MAYLYLNFFDNLTSGSRNFDDFYTQSLAEQYEGIKRRLGRNAPEDLQKFIAMCCPYSESEYYISMPALDRKIQRKIRRDGSEGTEYINNVVIRPALYRTYGIPESLDVIFIGDITFGSVIAFTVKGIELMDSGVAKLGEYRVNCTAACAFTTKTFSDRSGRQITVPDYGTRETHDAVLTHDFIDRLCEEVYPVSDPASVRKTIDRWKEYIEFRKYYLGVQSEKCEGITDVSVKEAYVVTKAAYRKNEEIWKGYLLDGHEEFSKGEQIILDRKISDADEFPLICVAIEKNRKIVLSETTGRSGYGKPKYEVYLRRYSRDSMGLSEQEPHYINGSLPKGFKFPYTLGERFQFIMTDLEPDCSDLEARCKKDSAQAEKEIDAKYRSMIEAELKKQMDAVRPGLIAAFDRKHEEYEKELNASLARDIEENQDKEVRREYDSTVLAPIQAEYEKKRKQLEEVRKKIGKGKREKLEEIDQQIETLTDEQHVAIEQAMAMFPISIFYEARNKRLTEAKRKSLDVEREAELAKIENAKRGELQAIYWSTIELEKEQKKQEIQSAFREKVAERIDNDTIRKYELYFCPENQNDSAAEIKKDLDKIVCRFLTYDNRAEKAKLERQEKALTSLLGGYVRNPYLVSYLFDPQKLSDAVSPLQDSPDWCLESLNDTQKLAVRRALASESIFLLQGPPGTGKTQVIAEITAQFAKQGKKILVSSETHKAIDNVFERLPKIPEIRPLRLIPSQNRKETNYSPERLVDNFYKNIQESLRRQIDRYEHFNETKETFSAQMQELRFDYDRLLRLQGENAKIEQERKRLSDVIADLSAQREKVRELRSDIQEELERFVRTEKLIDSYRFDVDGAKEQFLVAFKGRAETLLREYPCFAGAGSEKIREIMSADLSVIRSEIAEICGDDRLAMSEKERESLRRQLAELRDSETDEAPEEGQENYDAYKRIQKQFIALNKQIKELREAGAVDVSDSRLRALVSPEVLTDKALLQELPDAIALFKIRVPDLLSDLHREINEAKRPFSEQEENAIAKDNELARRINEAKQQYEALSEDSGVLEQEELNGMLKQKIGRSFRDFGIVREYDSGDMETAFAIIREEWNRLESDFKRTKQEDARCIPVLKEICKYLDSPDILEEDRQAYTRDLYNNVNVFGITCTSRDRFTKSQLSDLERYGIDDVDIRKQGIDVVIIDEVSKSSFLDLLIPILYGKTVILVGDHRQLPPMYDLRHMRESDFEGLDENIITKEKNDSYTALYEECFFKTLYERVPGDFRVMLNKQYRCHSHIMEVFNHFYGGNERGLMIGKKQQDDEKQHGLTVKVNGNIIIDPEHHIYFVDCEKKESSEDGSTSKQNKQEASVIIELLNGIDRAALELISKGKIRLDKERQIDERPSVGVICTYGDQASLIKKRRKGNQYKGFSQKDDEKLIISTVDDFQGDERDIILVSMVRNPRDHRFNAEFVKQFERINVAFSRARKLLIIVGAKKFLSEQKIDLPDLSGNHALDKTNYPVYQKIIDTIGLRGRLLTAEDVIGENENE